MTAAQDAGVRAAAVDAIAALLEQDRDAAALAPFVARFRGRMLETLGEAAPEVVHAGLRLAGALLAAGHVGTPQLLALTRCAPAARAAACFTMS
jgi:mannose/fructose/N-acetylgalactosamine-specific phosphotransferase system component IIC